MENKSKAEIYECPYKEPLGCICCDGAEEDFINDTNCTANGANEMFTDLAARCPECSKGIINPTFNKTFACDKCDYEATPREIMKIGKGYKFLKETVKELFVKTVD